MYIPQLSTRQRLAVRSGMATGTLTGITVAIVVGFVLFTTGLIFVVGRRLRKREARPKLLPGNYLKNLWWKWTPRGVAKHSRQMTTALTTDASTPIVNVAARNTTSSTPPQRGQSMRSIRSIITLPSYSRLPNEEERVIAREGERSGMDLVVEFPETAEEQETRREEEMESLYQIRVRRREELAEREERRRERRRQRQQARAAGDTVRLLQLSRESIIAREARRDRRTASAMLAEHQARDRQQRFASVSYADIGQVRHDGSRIRANSAESDNRPLLGAQRQSVHSILTLGSQPRSSMSGNSTMGTSILSGDEIQTGDADGGDLSTVQIPPPSYDYDDWGEAPAYESPISGTREHEGHLLTDILPQIRIDTASPSISMPADLVSPAAETAATTSGSHEPTSDQQENLPANLPANPPESSSENPSKNPSENLPANPSANPVEHPAEHPAEHPPEQPAPHPASEGTESNS